MSTVPYYNVLWWRKLKRYHNNREQQLCCCGERCTYSFTQGIYTDNDSDGICKWPSPDMLPGAETGIMRDKVDNTGQRDIKVAGKSNVVVFCITGCYLLTYATLRKVLLGVWNTRGNRESTVYTPPKLRGGGKGPRAGCRSVINRLVSRLQVDWMGGWVLVFSLVCLSCWFAGLVIYLSR